MCGAAGGGFGLASVVSTHRFLYVDIFISFVSSWFNTPTEPWINYREAGGVADSAWGFFDASESAYYADIYYWEASFSVTGEVPVFNTPDIPGKDMADDRVSGVVYITGHRWARRGPWHLAIEYHPEGTGIDATTTLSSENIDGKLVSEVNRPSDRPRMNKTIATVEPPPGWSPEQLFSNSSGSIRGTATACRTTRSRRCSLATVRTATFAG